MAGYAVGSASVSVVPNLDNFHRRIKADLRSMKVEAPVSVVPDINKAQWQALIAARLSGFEVKVKVVPDFDILGAQIQAKMAAAKMSQDVSFNVDLDTGKAMAKLALLSVAISGLGGVALGLGGGAIAALPGLLAAVAVPIAAITLGMDGIKKAAQVLQPQFAALKASVSSAFQTGLQPAFENLKAVMPVLQTGLTGTATSLSLIATKVTGVLSAGPGLAMLGDIFRNINAALAAMAPFFAQMTVALLQLMQIGSQVFGAVLVPQLNAFATSFQRMIAGFAATGQLQAAMAGVFNVIGALLPLLVQLISIGIQVMAVIGEPLANAFRTLSAIVGALTPILTVTAQVIVGVLNTALNALLPIVGQITPGFTGFATVLGQNVTLAIQTLAPIIAPLVNTFFQLMGALAPLLPLLAQVAVNIGGMLVSAFSFLMPYIQGFVNFLVTSPGFVTGLVIAIGALFAIFKVAAAVQAAYNAALVAYNGIMLIVRGATMVWAGVQWLLNAALSANPIALVIIAIAALVAGIIYAWQNSETFRNIVLAVWEAIKTAIAFTWYNILLPVFNAMVATIQWVGQMWSATWNAVSAVFTMVWNWIRDTAVNVWNFIVAFFQAGFAFYSALFSAVWNAISTFFSNTWNNIRNAAVTIWNAIVGFFQAAFAFYTALFTNVWNNILAFFNFIWNAIRAAAVAIWNAISAFFAGAFNAFTSFFMFIWNNILAFFTNTWNAIRNAGISIWNAISGFFGGALNAFGAFWARTWNGIATFFSNVWNGIRNTAISIWNGIVAVFRGGVNTVIDAANWLIDKVNKVLGFLSIPTIGLLARMEIGGVVPMMAKGGLVPELARGAALGGHQPGRAGMTRRTGGGFTTSSPTAIVGEGNPRHPEFVIPTDPKYRGRATMLYNNLGASLGAGAAVSPITTPAASSAVPELTGGGVLGWIGDTIGSIGRGIGSVASSIGNKLGDMMEWFSGNIGGLVNSAGDAVGGMIQNPFFKGIGVGLVKKMANGFGEYLNSQLGSMMGGPGGPISGNLAQWIRVAMAIAGAPPNWFGPLSTLIMRESGGNPRAINRWDSNARKGTPSGGLMQTIGPTFAAYRDRRLPNNMFDPIANIVAGINYIRGRYGTIFRVQQAVGRTPKGYDSGGIAGGMGFMPKYTMQPERVLSPAQTRTYDSMLPLLRSLNYENAGGNSGGPVIGEVHQYLSDGASGREYAEELAFEMRKSRGRTGVY